MGLRGPQSENHKIHRIFPERPKAPRHLPKRAKKLWKEITESLPSDYFRVAELNLLEKYVMAIHIYELALVQVNKHGLVIPMGGNGYFVVNPALVICNKQVALMSTLATKLRLTPNSRVSKWVAGSAKEAVKSRRTNLMFETRKDDE